MIDLRLLREDPDRVRASQRARGEDEGLVDTLLAADATRREALQRFETLRARQKALGSQVAKAKGDEKAALLAETKQLSQDVRAAEAESNAAGEAADRALLALSNIVDPASPVGGEEDFTVLEEIGEIPTFDFEPRDHVELGRMLGAIDLDRGAKVSGSRFYFFTGVGALLASALVRYAQDYAVREGLTPVLPPVLVRPEAMEGTGFLGQAAENVYHLGDEGLYLVGTSEVPLAAFHMDEILDAGELPLRYAAYSPCFRREAGAHGKDTRGIIRVHQFDKVEMFVFCKPEDADAEHQKLLAHEKAVLQAIGLPFRVIDVATGDLGASATRKFDCEAWVPTQGKYREVTSTSNCTEFQARRLRTRFRDEGATRPVATLNGTLIAVPRVLVAILENFQQADGSVGVPEVLRPYVGRDVLTPIPGR
ncbi:seryl-tRNA synthetase [Motilibacter rhizosphaerae]|uniref:Serine--tRNA ligase n=1 Tax=Motilibacter rhizosphaerae TaxID=598652 RepID=A0A4Q7NVM3_9ACTN|nr:serine--tRNA ligase [Motilibacter rhizosphaerae]RZS91313.1 seryl-tRNA synthetase [Motilibacter rhizosphaerae]